MVCIKDWVGNSKSIYSPLGASNHVEDERAGFDYYATPPQVVDILLEQEQFSPHVWEPACGEGHISEALKAKGYKVKSSDIIDRGYTGTEVIDFLSIHKKDIEKDYSRDIITNPPYKMAQQFVEKAIEISLDSTKIAMFCKLTFLESQKRRKMFDENPPKCVYVFTNRVQCAKNGEFPKDKNGNPQWEGGAACYAWFVWEKGFLGDPIIKWVN